LGCPSSEDPRRGGDAAGSTSGTPTAVTATGTNDPTTGLTTGLTTGASATSQGETDSSTGGETGVADGSSESGDPAPECGNGIVEGDEACDDSGDSAACNMDCTAAECGDGYVNRAAGEVCDDGDTDPGNGCNNLCLPRNCGDGVVEGAEVCDDGNRDQTDGCVGCQDAVCGDGFIQAGVEDCDDQNMDETDACLSDCVAASCGDGFVQVGVEDCEDGNADDTDACVGCQDAVCGDGFVQAGVEDCDDQNADPDDGCDACASTCGNDCWGDEGCMTDAGRCVRFTCADGDGAATACDDCFGWQPVSYDQWLNGGYCNDITDRYRADHQYETRCGGAPVCCGDPAGCGGGDNAWHFSSGAGTRYLGPCLGCMGVDNCTFWDEVATGTYTRITACERM